MNKYGSNNVRVGRGMIGNTGPTGSTGSQGPKGDTGEKGNTGSSGSNGNDGDDGLAGYVFYISPNTLMIPSLSDGTVESYLSAYCIGRLYKGDTQIDISSITATIGTENVSVSQAAEVEGNGYGIKFSVSNITSGEGRFKAAISYGGIDYFALVHCLKMKSGAKGDTGDTGIKGADGGTGPKGNDGAPGTKGDDGNDGPVGPQGDKGDDGSDSVVPGPKGDKGDSGSGFAEASVVITETQLKTTFTAGITVVEAVAGKVIMPTYIKAKISSIGTQYDFGTGTMLLRYASIVSAIATWSTAFLESAVERTDTKKADDIDSAPGNSALMIYGTDNAATGVGGEITVTIGYVEVTA